MNNKTINKLVQEKQLRNSFTLTICLNFPKLQAMLVIRRNIVYVGGLAETVNEEILHAAFIPFGILKSIQIPRDHNTSRIFLLFGVYFLLILLM
jgi:RNA recognition motif-containing protein